MALLRKGLAVQIVLWLAFLAGSAACASVAATAKDAPSATPKLGVFAGPSNVAGVHSFEDWLGRPVDYVLQFQGVESWKTISQAWGLRRWRPTKSHPSQYRLVIGVPLLPNQGTDTLAQGAAGAYDAYFRQLARGLAGAGFGNSILRLGWEFNGGWYKWTVWNTTDAANFVTYWRRIVTTMRSVAPHLQFDWNLAFSWNRVDPSLAYPGNAYVDYIGMDLYDQGWMPDYQDPVKRWDAFVAGPDGLAWLAGFAKSHHKPISIPEWGLVVRDDGHGGGDDPYFVEHMLSWIASHHVAYHIYFEQDAQDGQHNLTNGLFPKSAALFRQKLGRPVTTGS